MLPEFENTQVAFEYRSNKELKRARFLFSSMGSPTLTNLGMKMTKFAIAWKLPVKGLIKHTLFDQFCGDSIPLLSTGARPRSGQIALLTCEIISVIAGIQRRLTSMRSCPGDSISPETAVRRGLHQAIRPGLPL